MSHFKFYSALLSSKRELADDMLKPNTDLKNELFDLLSE
jgi:hypothetical protein